MYTSRIVSAGKYENNPFVSFTLASRSIPFREIRINEEKGRMNVFPKRGFEDHPTNQDPEIDNYSCITTGKNNYEDSWAVAFNGHMNKRTHYNLLEGMNPFIAMDMTLLDFRGQKGDARIGSIAFYPYDNDMSFWLGVNDVEKPEKRICGYPNKRIQDLENRAVFIYDKNTDLESLFTLNEGGIKKPQELAEYIHNNIIGEEITFGLSTGVAINYGNGFELGVYNEHVDESKINYWHENTSH